MVCVMMQRQTSILTSCPLLMMLSLPLLMLTFSATSITTTTGQLLDDPSLSSDPLDLDHRLKRLLPHTNNQCSQCFSTYDPASCLRCWKMQFTVVPVYATKRADQDLLAETEKRRVYEPLQRFQRGSGCGCCYLSRFSNRHCCAVCSMTTKRTGKRSEGPMMSLDDVPVTSDWEAEKRQAKLMASADCLCCLQDGEEDCCDRCFAK